LYALFRAFYFGECIRQGRAQKRIKTAREAPLFRPIISNAGSKNGVTRPGPCADGMKNPGAFLRLFGDLKIAEIPGN
jgi:hypothetical protein